MIWYFGCTGKQPMDQWWEFQNLKKYGIKQNIVAQMNLKNSLIHVSGR